MFSFMTDAGILNKYRERILTLTEKNVNRALAKYVEGSITEENIEKWANFLEMNENVVYEKGFEDWISHVLFVLSTPSINGPITPDLAKELLALPRNPRPS